MTYVTREELNALAVQLLLNSRFGQLSIEESYHAQKHLSALELAQYNASNALFLLCNVMADEERARGITPKAFPQHATGYEEDALGDPDEYAEEPDTSYEDDVRGEEAYRRANTPAIELGGHDFDEDCVCIRCGFDGAEHYHWRTQTYEGRAAAMEGEANEPPCR